MQGRVRAGDSATDRDTRLCRGTHCRQRQKAAQQTAATADSRRDTHKIMRSIDACCSAVGEEVNGGLQQERGMNTNKSEMVTLNPKANNGYRKSEIRQRKKPAKEGEGGVGVTASKVQHESIGGGRKRSQGTEKGSGR